MSAVRLEKTYPVGTPVRILSDTGHHLDASVVGQVVSSEDVHNGGVYTIVGRSIITGRPIMQLLAPEEVAATTKA